MKPEYYLPVVVLRPFIKTFLIMGSEKEISNKILPDSTLVMAFRYKGSVSTLDEGGHIVLPSAVISGLRKTSRIINYAPGTANLLVVFREGGANAFLREPLHAFFGQSIALDAMIPQSELGRIEEQLGEVRSNAERIRLVETFLLSRMALLSGKRGMQPDLLIGRLFKE